MATSEILYVIARCWRDGGLLLADVMKQTCFVATQKKAEMRLISGTFVLCMYVYVCMYVVRRQVVGIPHVENKIKYPTICTLDRMPSSHSL